VRVTLKRGVRGPVPADDQAWQKTSGTSASQ
jgi:hypothetical protein